MKRAALLLLLVVTATACGPSLPVEVGMREEPVDIVYGRQGGAPLPTRAPDASPDPSTFPGFIAPPITLQPDDDDVDVLPEPDPCPTASAFAVPARDAGSSVERVPGTGSYAYRRNGWLRTATFAQGEAALESAPQQPMSPTATRTVTRAREIATGQIEIVVAQAEGSLVTTTTYLADNDAGLFISRIVTERADLPGGPAGQGGRGVESFNPQPPVKIATMPFSREPLEGNPLTPQQRGHGVDPLTGISMEVYSRTVERARVDVCGTVVDSWLINVTGTFTRPGVREYSLRGSFNVAPQLGGLIVADDIELTGGRDESAGVYFHQYSSTTLSSLTPRQGSAS